MRGLNVLYVAVEADGETLSEAEVDSGDSLIYWARAGVPCDFDGICELNFES